MDTLYYLTISTINSLKISTILCMYTYHLLTALANSITVGFGLTNSLLSHLHVTSNILILSHHLHSIYSADKCWSKVNSSSKLGWKVYWCSLSLHSWQWRVGVGVGAWSKILKAFSNKHIHLNTWIVHSSPI